MAARSQRLDEPETRCFVRCPQIEVSWRSSMQQGLERPTREKDRRIEVLTDETVDRRASKVENCRLAQRYHGSPVILPRHATWRYPRCHHRNAPSRNIGQL